MDMRSWKKVLLQWVTECGFMDRNYFNIEQTDIDVFYQNFSKQHQKTSRSKSQLNDFLKEFYPNFEFNFDDENCLSSAEYIYVYSLLLHFCCVKHPETVFHEICQRLPDLAQQCIAAFFKELLETEPITKEALRHAIAEVATSQITPPRLNDSFSSVMTSISVGGLSTSSLSRCESPLKTPKRCAGPHRISPSTPKSYLLEERTRELYNLRAQLDTERYEKGLLEVQIKQNEDKIQKFSIDHKKLVQQIQDLKNDMLVKASNDTSSNRNGEENQIQKRILKELSQKEEEIIKLSDIVRSLQEEKVLVEEKLIYAEKQIVICMNRIKELDFKVDELKDELEKKNSQIQYLTDRKLELEHFIAETRSSSSDVNVDLNASVDCMDGSYVRNNTTGSNSLSSPENLGASVIDVQLREKEHENQLLKNELQNVRREHQRLAKHLTKLTQEFDLPIDASSPTNSENSETDVIENDSSEDGQVEFIISCEEQFSVFNSCMDKIDKFHKTEKNKIKLMEEDLTNLQQQNEDLSGKLKDLEQEVNELKQEIACKEEQNKTLEKSKEYLQDLMEKSEKDLEENQRHKDKLYEKVQSLEQAKEQLNENIKDLTNKLESQQKQNSDLLDNNSKLLENEKSLQTQLKLLRNEFSDKTLKWEEKLKELSDNMKQQCEDTEKFKQAELAIKCNYEQLVVQNEKLKEESRKADNHLSQIKSELREKETQLSVLGEEIIGFRKKNVFLEEKITQLLEDYEQEKLSSNNTQAELDVQVKQLKENLSKTKLLMDAKEHECELKAKKQQELEHKLESMLKLFAASELKDTDFESFETHVKEMYEKNQDLQAKVFKLEESQKEDNIKIQELSKELEVRKESLAKAQEDLVKFRQENEDFKSKVLTLEEIQSESSTKIKELTNENEKKAQSCVKTQEELLKLKEDHESKEKELEQLRHEVEKCKSELIAKEQELKVRLKEASSEYEASLERIAVELKLEREHHNTKEMELILRAAEHTETTKKLAETEKELRQLQTENQKLQINCERLQQFESQVDHYAKENNKLRHDIETFKKEVTQNAHRLLEADKALSEFMELTKEQNTAKSDLQKKEEILKEMEIKLEQQSCNEKQLEELKQQLVQQTELVTNVQEQLQILSKDKERLSKEAEEKTQQILKEQHDKLVLLNSLEKSTDQLKQISEEKHQQVLALELKLKDIKEQFDSLTLQNTKLQGDLVEREAELRLSQEEHQLKKEEFSQKIALHLKQINEKSDQLEAIDMSLMELVAIMENNFNLDQELRKKDVKNVFNFNEKKGNENIQKMRKHLNFIFHQQRELNQELQNLVKEKGEALNSVETLRASHDDLLGKLSQQEKQINEMTEHLDNEELIMEKRVFHEVKRLEGDLQNLEMVNERLANENVKIQVTLGNVEQDYINLKSKNVSLEEEVLKLKDEVRNKTINLEKLQQEEKKLHSTLKEKQVQYEKSVEKTKHLDLQLKDKTAKLQNLEKEYQEAKEKSSRNQMKLAHYQKSNENHLAEQKKLQEKLKLIQVANESLELDVENKSKELVVLKNMNSELLQQTKDLEEQFNMTSKKLDEMLTNKLNAETKCEQLQSEVCQLKRDLNFHKSQLQTQQEESTRLSQEIDALKLDKQHLRDEYNENKLSLQKANDNITQLIQQISSIRFEKEASLDEIALLRKQLEDTGKNRTSSETKMKSVLDKSQELERKLLTAENELKCLKANLEKSENSSEKLQIENKKLRDSQEAATKRIEKLALKLGDSQAKSAKLERDNEKLNKTLEAHTSTVEALQREKDILQSEAKSLKERLSRAERAHEQLAAKVQNLEHLNTSLQLMKQKLESSDIDGKTKLSKLEKLRDQNEEKIRKLINSLNNSENANVKLNLEIGALNSQLQEVKSEHSLEQKQQIEELNLKLTEAQDLYQKYQDINEKLKIELSNLKEENSSLNDQLSKASLSLQITSQKCERFTTEMEQIRADLLIMRQEKSQIELQHETSIQKLNQFENQNTKLVYERKNLVKSLEQRIARLEEELAAKSKEVDDLHKEIEVLKENSASHASLLQQNSTANLSELEDLRTKLSLAKDLREKEQQIISQLRLDNQILHTKYQEAKQRILDANQMSEERIKENRLELEGKLEKMKNKMDGPHSLDDSMSALLSTTAGGTRKKCTGVTHYKRPGPPTPSKNGGRLSFGCISEPGREILKENYDSSGGASSAKTPARFNFFASRFSMGTTKDEKTKIIKKEFIDIINIKKEPNDITKVIHKPKIKHARRLLAGVGYTSTPRKSKVHYDQRRLLDNLMTSSPSPSPLTLDNKTGKIEKKVTPPDVSLIETPLTALGRRSSLAKAPVYKTNAKRMEAIAGGLRRSRRNSSMYGRRLSRRMHEICTPTSGDTTSSALSTPVVKKEKSLRHIVISSTATTSGGLGKAALLQRRKKPKREKGSRPSLYLRGNIFAKPNKGALHDTNRYKSKKQRLEHFNLGRDISSFKKGDEIDKTISSKHINDITYDLRNNNYATYNHNKLLGETVLVAKCQPKVEEYRDVTFTFGEEQFEHSEDLDYMEDYVTDEEYYDDDDDETEADDGDEENEEEDCRNNKKYELVSSQDLEDFDRFIANAKHKVENDDFSSQSSSKHFEQLLGETQSNAPFEVKHIQFNLSSKSSRSTQSRSSKSQRSSSSSHQYRHSHSSSHSHHQSHSTNTHYQTHSQNEHDVSMATPHISPNNPTCHLSRTIYGGTVIYNHRLPNINTTFVRKSSIYVKNRRRSSRHHLESSSCDDLVLITNQTITFVDIVRMWSQMDSSTRLIVSFAILASFTTLLGLFLSFFSRR